MKIAYVIMRAQPFHYGHKGLIDHALSIADKVCVVLGDTGCARDIRNPWTDGERVAMIAGSYVGEASLRRISFCKVEDHPYDDGAWVKELRFVVSTLMFPEPGDEQFLVGHKKDASSFYLDLFPEWTYVQPLAKPMGTSGTALRELMADFDPSTPYFKKRINGRAPQSTIDEICLSMAPKRFRQFRDEWNEARDMARDWVCPATNRYGGPILVAVDALVESIDSILVIERGGDHGAGSIALPGGFLNDDERMGDAALRELEEETGYVSPMTRDSMRAWANMPGTMVPFDAIRRSTRGRVITNCLHYVTTWAEQPVKAADDAAKAFWMPKSEIQGNKAKFFSDHFHIIRHFVKEMP